MYTESEIRSALIAKHGAKLKFLLRHFDNLGFEFKALDPFESSGFSKGKSELCHFAGDCKGVHVDGSARTMVEAVEFALDGLREWARAGASFTVDWRQNYFGYLTQSWAKDGEGAGDVPALLGTTIDWLYLFSRKASQHPNDRMYPVFRSENGGPSAMTQEKRPDLFDIYCWVFCSKWTPISPYKTVSTVPTNSWTGRLHKRYWDSPWDEKMQSYKGNTEDQTHHFAGYFWWGSKVYSKWDLLSIALSHTGDWDRKHSQVINRGDVESGILAAQWGARMRAKPGYIGKAVEKSLRTAEMPDGFYSLEDVEKVYKNYTRQAILKSEKSIFIYGSK